MMQLLYQQNLLLMSVVQQFNSQQSISLSKDLLPMSRTKIDIPSQQNLYFQ